LTCAVILIFSQIRLQFRITIDSLWKRSSLLNEALFACKMVAIFRRIGILIISLMYGIGDPYVFLDTMLSKYQWKSLIKSKIHSYRISTISEVCNWYSSLKYLKGSYKIGQCHPLATTISANMRDIIRIPIRLKIATGTYILLDVNKATFAFTVLNR
jgi:hypothetical protein